MNLSNWIIKYRIHFVAWSSFFLYEQIVLKTIGTAISSIILEVSHFIAHIGFFYLHALVILPFIFKKRNVFLWALLIIPIQLAAYILTHFGIDKFLLAIEVIKIKKVYVLNSVVISANLFRAIYFLGFSTGYYFLRTFIIERKRSVALEQEKLTSIIRQQAMEQELTRAQFAYLKAQINPHFLFNTLTFVHNKVSAHSPVAGETVMRLAEMMRYAIESNETSGLADLGEEILQVENLIFLHEVKRGEELALRFEYPPQVRAFQFTPLVLLTFVENMFKHGDLTNEENPARIQLGVKDQQFYIHTENQIQRTPAAHSHRTGLQNVERRLQLVYGTDLTFKTEAVDDRYSVDVLIPLAVLEAPVLRANSSTTTDR